MNASYVPGDHVVAVTGRAVVMAGPDHSAELLALVDGEASPLGIISALSGGDLTRLPEFAAGVLDGADLVVLVRGPYSVRTEGQKWSGRDVATWREHRVPAGGEVVIDHDDATDDRDLPLGAGVVLAARVTWRPEPSADAPAVPAAVEDRPSAAQDPDVTVVDVEDATDVRTGADPDHGARPVDDAPVEPEDAGEVDEGFDETIGATIQGQRRPAPEPAVEEPVEGDHDGRTITAEQMRELRARKESGAPATTSPMSVTLSVSGGETVDLTKPVLIGRSPRAAHKSGAQLPRMLVVDDPYVSGTHLEVGLEDGAVVATDRSTNGTMLTRSEGGQPERLPKDEPTRIGDGCVLHLSDDLTVTVSVHGAAG